MSSYIQNVQDKLEKVNPPQTDWQFEAGLLTTRQSKYDSGHQKASNLYGKVLNAGLTRDENIQSRDEFFKTVNQDLKKIAGMDLSLDSNVSKAQNVFNQIYDNDHLVKDMVWTDQFQTEMKRANSFRDCVDPSKCGGEYWNDGVKAMAYKREEFKNMNNRESLEAQPVRYIPYNNMMEKALKYAKDANLNVTVDQLTGRYITRTKNGTNLVSPLTDLFTQLFQDNPDLHDMYKVQAYNARKDWTYNAVNSGQYSSLEEASKGYVEMRSNEIIEASQTVSNGVDYDVSSLELKLNAIKEDYRKGLFNDGDTKKMAEVQELQNALVNAKTAQGYTDMVKNAQKNMNNQTNMNAIGDILDNAHAVTLFDKDLNVAARTLAHQNMEVTMTADDFAKEDQKHAHAVAMENLQQRHKISLEEKKAELKGNEVDPNALIYMIDYKKKADLAKDFNIGSELSKAFPENEQVKQALSGKSDLEIAQWFRSTSLAGIEHVRAAYNQAIEKRNILEKDANKAAINAYKYGNPTSDLDLNWKQFDTETYNAFMTSIPEASRKDFDIPLGVSNMSTGAPLMFEFPGNTQNDYFQKDGDWYRGGDFIKKAEDYVKITNPLTIDKLNSQAVVLK